MDRDLAAGVVNQAEPLQQFIDGGIADPPGDGRGRSERRPANRSG